MRHDSSAGSGRHSGRLKVTSRRCPNSASFGREQVTFWHVGTSFSLSEMGRQANLNCTWMGSTEGSLPRFKAQLTRSADRGEVTDAP